VQSHQLRLSVRALALSFVLGAGGCVVLGYDFEKQPPASCEKAADCPGEDTFCGTPACEQGVCTFVNVKPATEKPLGQRVGDCQVLECDGAGHAVSKLSNDDKPDDGSECTEDKCSDGTPLFVPVEKDTDCGKSLKCDGTGFCAGCTMPTECGDDTPCLKWSCTEGVCIRTYEPEGLVISDAMLGDCMAEACDGAGKLVTVLYAMDPADDIDPCTTDACQGEVTVHENAANGTACGMGCQSCTDGVCGPCSPGFVCDALACVSVGDQPPGSACVKNADCMSGFCVDGVCCESECSDKCKACSNAKTGQANGVCATALDGTNPGDRCMELDVCVGGTCRCENGVQDGSELDVDCGGVCAPCSGQWVCNGLAGCGAPKQECCNIDCFDCPNETTQCFAVQSTACFLGEPPRSFTAGVVGNGGCFFQNACNRVTCICK
jgi:hypothetical protein